MGSASSVNPFVTDLHIWFHRGGRLNVKSVTVLALGLMDILFLTRKRSHWGALSNLDSRSSVPHFFCCNNLFILSVYMGLSAMITGFWNPNLNLAETVKYLLSIFFAADFLTWALDYGALCWTRTSWIPGSFRYGFFFIWQQTVCFSWWSTWICLRDSLSVIAAFLFWHKRIQTADMLKHCWRHRIRRTLLSFPFLANPGCNTTAELAFLCTCGLWM